MAADSSRISMEWADTGLASILVLLLAVAGASPAAAGEEPENEREASEQEGIFDEQAPESDPLSGAGSMGAGLALGSLTTALTGKYYLDDRNALQVFVGTWLYGGYGSFSIGADYVHEFETIAENETGRAFVGVGGGGGLAQFYSDDGPLTVLFIDGVGEIGWHFKEFPLELVFDWRPTFMIGPCHRFGALVGSCFALPQFGLSGRWYF